MDPTPPKCLFSVCFCLPLMELQIQADLSQKPDTRILPSWENARDMTSSDPLVHALSPPYWYCKSELMSRRSQTQPVSHQDISQRTLSLSNVFSSSIPFSNCIPNTNQYRVWVGLHTSSMWECQIRDSQMPNLDRVVIGARDNDCPIRRECNG